MSYKPIDNLEAKRLKVARAKCLQSLLFQTCYNFRFEKGTVYRVEAMHEQIAEALEKVLRGEISRLIIEVMPRSGKTELAVKNFIAHGLALNAASKYIHLSYSDSLALDNSEQVKDIVTSDTYQQLFPYVTIKQDSKAKNKWYTAQGGGVLARAAAGSVTGFGAGISDELEAEDLDEFLTGLDSHYNGDAQALKKKFQFGGAIIIDDPIKPEDADSDVKRVRVNERFDSTIRNRRNSTKTPIIVIMQRLHPEDLSGYLQRPDDPDEWTVIKLPALVADPAEPNGYRSILPHLMPVSALLALKKGNELVFERQYQQNPKAKAGLLFPEDELNFYDPNDPNLWPEEGPTLADPDHVYLAADPANKGGDFFASAPARLIGNRIYINSVLFNKEGALVSEKRVADTILKVKPAAVGIEGVLGWRETVKRIRTAVQDKGYPGEVRMLHPRTGKHTRIVNRSSFIKAHFWFRKDYMKYPEYYAFMRVLTAYKRVQTPGQENAHDDAPDLLEMIAAYFEKNFPELFIIDAEDLSADSLE